MIRKIGYACINLSLDCRSSRTFRLVSYSEERLAETIKGNLNCLQQILEFNLKKQIYFFRITSDLIPFASHPVNQFPWQRVFKQQFKEIGRFISSKGMRVSLHPGQFTILNSPRKEVVKNARRELIYHNQVLDLMGLNSSHKIQIHVGGVYGNKQSARLRFEKNFQCLPHSVKNRLVIENDDRSFSLADCLKTSSKLRIPIVLDSLHHSLLNEGEPLEKAFKNFVPTWSKKDGRPIVDYSEQAKNKRPGSHASELTPRLFKGFIERTRRFNFDLMLELKAKEKNAFRALKILAELSGKDRSKQSE